MTTISTTRRAAALQTAFGGNSSAYAYTLDGSEYVVTSGTGEGCDFAYEAEDIDPESFTADWDYSDWCNGVTVASDLRIAVAYYMQTGRVLGHSGSCSPALTDEQVKALEVARDLAE